MNIYDLPLKTKMLDVKTGKVGEVTIVHPPKSYRYRWYTVTFDNGKNKRVHSWDFPKYFQVIEG